MKRHIHLPDFLDRHTPEQLLEELFEACSLNEWRYSLWLWVNTVMTEDLNWSSNGFSESPASLLYNHAYLTKLVEAAWALRPVEGETPPLTDERKEALIQQAIFIPKRPKLCDVDDRIITFHYLSTEEWNNPKLVFGSAFKVYSLMQWHEILFDWLEYGLSNSSMIENTYFNTNLYLYTQLNKLVEAAFLLQCRNGSV